MITTRGTSEQEGTRTVADWSVFEGFKRPVEERSWAAVSEWTAAVEGLLQPTRDRVALLRHWWHEALAEFGGDPGARDWATFRPLRLDREEDWADWLGQLIKDSRTGRLAWLLLAACEDRLSLSDYVASDVLREVFHEGCRADLVIGWRADDSYTHIEVKVGDQDLAKTLTTAWKMERLHVGLRTRSDFILLLPEQLNQWAHECASVPAMGERVKVLTWFDVARALRVVLLETEDEPLFWRAWGFAFCGAIEQQLLGLPAGSAGSDWTRGLSLEQLELAERLFDCKGGR